MIPRATAFLVTHAVSSARPYGPSASPLNNCFLPASWLKWGSGSSRRTACSRVLSNSGSFLNHTPCSGASGQGTDVLLVPHCHSRPLFPSPCPNHSALKVMQSDATCYPVHGRPLSFADDRLLSHSHFSCHNPE